MIIIKEFFSGFWCVIYENIQIEKKFIKKNRKNLITIKILSNMALFFAIKSSFLLLYI